MITRIHQQVADFAFQTSQAVDKQHHGKAFGLALASRLTAVALFALQTLVLAITAFRYIVQSFVAVHLARKTGLTPSTAKALAVWCKADMALQFTGLAMAFGSILSAELFCNKLKLHKTIFNQSIKMDIAMSSVSSSGVNHPKQIVELAGLTFDQKAFNASFMAAWQKKALEANEKAPNGSVDIDAVKSKVLQAGLIDYFKVHFKGMKEAPVTKAREKIKIKLLGLIAKKGNVSAEEKLMIELLRVLEPQAYATAKRLTNIPARVGGNPSRLVNPKPPGKPTGTNSAAPDFDIQAYLRDVQDAEDHEIAMKRQRELDGEMAQDIFMRDLLYSQGGRRRPQGNRGRNGNNGPGNVPRGMYANEDVYNQILTASMYDAVEKNRSQHDLDFSKAMFACQMKMRIKLGEEAIAFEVQFEKELRAKGEYISDKDIEDQCKAECQLKLSEMTASCREEIEKDIIRKCKQELYDQGKSDAEVKKGCEEELKKQSKFISSEATKKVEQKIKQKCNSAVMNHGFKGKLSEALSEIGKFSEGDIQGADVLAMTAIWQTGILEFYSSKDKKKIILWKEPVVKALSAKVSELRKKHKKLDPTEQTDKLLGVLLTTGRDAKTDKVFERLRKNLPDLAKVVEELFVVCEELKEANLIVNVQKELITSLSKFEQFKKIKVDGSNVTVEALLLDLLAYGETKISKGLRDTLKAQNKNADEALADVYKHVGALVHIYEKKLFNNYNIKNGISFKDVCKPMPKKK